jgi:indole-3-glycerol phosphate synthase
MAARCCGTFWRLQKLRHAPVDVLQQIYEAKRSRLEREQLHEPYDAVRARALSRLSERRPFLSALRNAADTAIVAEVKRASPSAGLIAPIFDPQDIARAYQAAGADAISVLTEHDRFLGELSYLDDVRRVTTLPLLRKDFLWTRYHVAQGAANGADCILLILAGISDEALHECLDEARQYAIDVLVEVHDEAELGRAIAAGLELIGINNRDLQAFTTDLAVSERLLPKVSAGIFTISESGIRSPSDAARLRAAGAQGLLIGEALMRAQDPCAFIASLRSDVPTTALEMRERRPQAAR